MLAIALPGPPSLLTTLTELTPFMTPRPSTLSNHCLAGKVSRFVPVVALAGLCWSSVTALATPEDGRVALNAKLANFAVQATQPGTALVTAKTTTTAMAVDLISALVSVSNDPANTVSFADLVAGALVKDGLSKVRGDRNKIAGRLIDSVLTSTAFDTSDTAAIKAIITAAIGAGDDGNNAIKGLFELDLSGRAAIVASALRRASAANAGTDIADAVLPFIKIADPVKNDIAMNTFATAALNGVGTGTGRVASFVDEIFVAGGFSSNVSRQNRTWILAESVVKNTTTAGEVTRSFTGTLTEGAAVTFVTQTILTRPKLAKAIAEITAACADRLSSLNHREYAQAIIGNLTAPKPALMGLVVNGAIRSMADDSKTSNIIGGILNSTSDLANPGIANGQLINTDVLRVAFAGAVLSSTGTNGADLAVESAKAQTVAIDMAGRVSTLFKDELGMALVKAVALNNPDAAGGIATGIIGTGGIADKTAFSVALVKAIATNNVAAGSIAGAVSSSLVGLNAASTLTLRVDFSTALIKAAGKAAAGIAGRVSSTGVDVTQFSKDLALKVPGQVTGVVVGITQAFPLTAETIVRDVVLAKNSLGLTPFKIAAAKIAGAAGRGINEEKIADIGAILAASMTITGAADLNNGNVFLAASQAAGIASELAKAINTKPKVMTALDRTTQVTTHNRADEMGELAAAMVGGLLQQLSGNDLTAMQKTIAGIGSAIIKALSPKNLQSDLNAPADLREAADIVGSIAQVISMSDKLDYNTKKALLGQGLGTGVYSLLENSLILTVGPKYALQARAAFKEVRDLFVANATSGNNTKLSQIVQGGDNEAISNGTINATGKFEIGSVNDPESPVTPL